MQTHTGSYSEPRTTDLVRLPPSFVPAQVGRVAPTIRSVAQGTDPYASTLPQPVQYRVTTQVTPISRAQALVLKVTAVTLALALFTLAALLLLNVFTFFLWVLCASGEWVFCFVLVALLDWRESPAALAWRQNEAYLDLMRREQAARLWALYGSGGGRD